MSEGSNSEQSIGEGDSPTLFLPSNLFMRNYAYLRFPLSDRVPKYWRRWGVFNFFSLSQTINNPPTPTPQSAQFYQSYLFALGCLRNTHGLRPRPSSWSVRSVFAAFFQSLSKLYSCQLSQKKLVSPVKVPTPTQASLLDYMKWSDLLRWYILEVNFHYHFKIKSPVHISPFPELNDFKWIQRRCEITQH